MSYDLYFVRDPEPSLADFRAFFEDRPHYALEGSQAVYGNEDTGVYFSFELPDQEELEEFAHVLPRYWASFRLNFIRPAYFAMEAGIELQAFVAHFDTLVCDGDGDGDGDDTAPEQTRFDAEAFRQHWLQVNDASCAHLIEVGSIERPEARPRRLLQQVWQWNYGRNRLQEGLEADLFVPRIDFFRSAGEVFSAFLWPDAIPTVMPRTDRVVVCREQLAPRRRLRRRPDYAVVLWADLEPLLDMSRRQSEPLEHWFVDHSNSPKESRAWVRARAATDDLERIASDDVLDCEMLP